MGSSSAHLHHVQKSNSSGGLPPHAGHHSSSCGPTGSGVRRWAHKLLLRGITGSSVPASPVTNGCSGGLKLSTSLSIPGTKHNPFASFRSSSAGGERSETGAGGGGGGAGGGHPPPLPPKQPRHKKPMPPPRTSSFLTRPKAHQQHQGQHQYHGDFIRSRPVTPTMVAADGTLLPVKSVRFNREVAANAARVTGGKDALDDATIGLEIAANLALAFARDVRRERIAAGASPSPAPPLESAGAGGGHPLFRSSPYGRLYSSGRTGQEVTLSEFYQLLKYVGQGHPAEVATGNAGSAAPSTAATTGSVSPAASGDAATHSSALNGAAASRSTSSKSSDAHAASTGLAASSSILRPTTPTPCNQHLPPGYLTSRSFRQKAKRSQTPTPEPQLLRARRSASTSEDVVSYDNLSPTTSTCPSVDSSALPLRTRSLPRSHVSGRSTESLHGAGAAPPSQPAVETGAGGSAPSESSSTVKPIRNWNEILHLIGQVISEQYPPGSGGGGGGGGGGAVGAVGAVGHAHGGHSSAGEGKTPQRRYQRPCSGSLSDSEEAYHRRKNPEAALARERHYDTLKPTSSSSSAAASKSEDNQSYLASLSHRLQIEQYIVKTLNHITASTRAPPSAGASNSLLANTSANQVESYVQCWGSPERGSRPKLTREMSKIGLERALLRLDHRRTERHPRIYQHHHWRITPPECNALFLCKVVTPHKQTKRNTHTNKPSLYQQVLAPSLATSSWYQSLVPANWYQLFFS